MNYIQIVADQQTEMLSLPMADYCEREQVNEIELDSSLAQVVIGMRRSGKTTLCHQALRRGNRNYAYINFDDDSFAGITVKDLNDILEAAYVIYGNFTHIFLDEIQNVDGWELFVNRLLRKGLRVILTGSNSNALSQEMGTHLTGRYKEIEVLPFSFQEYLAFKKISVDMLTTLGNAKLIEEYRNYASRGGLPEACGMNDSRNYIKTLYNAILFKDVSRRYNVRYPRVLSSVSAVLMQNFCREVSCLALADALGVKSSHTIQNYVEYLSNAYLIRLLCKFSYKPALKQTHYKAYSLDLGLVSSFSGIENTESNWGWRMENLVFLKLYANREKGNYDLYYWGNGCEVDFVVVSNQRVVRLIQVSYSLNDTKTRDREISALTRVAKKLNCSELYIVNLMEKYELTQNNFTIHIIPIVEFLLKL